MRGIKRRTALFQQGLFGEVIEELRPQTQPVPMTLDFETHAVRMVMIKGQPWWVASDVCRVLEIGNASLAVNGRADRPNDGLDDDEKGVVIVNTPSGVQEMLAVNQFGVFQLILKSRKPQAKRFKRWLTHEVLPSIQKTGSYTLAPPTRVAKVAKRLKCDPKTAERRVEVIDGNKRSRSRLSGEGPSRRRFVAWYDGLNKAQFSGKTAGDLRKIIGLKKWQTPLDHMGEIPLGQRALAISLVEMRIRETEDETGKPLDDETQEQILCDVFKNVVDSSFDCLGHSYGFGLRDDRRRGPVLDVVRRIEAA